MDRSLGFYSLGSFPENFPGFLITRHGQFTKITGPAGLTGQYDNYNPGPALSINDRWEIAGTYFAPAPKSVNPFGGDFRAFVRSPDGRYVAFDAATYPPCCIWTAASGINSTGTVTGSFNDGFSVNHGFWKTRRGTVTTFDVPGAGTETNAGTVAIGITEGGVIAGYYRDAKHETHGFLFLPKHCNDW